MGLHWSHCTLAEVQLLTSFYQEQGLLASDIKWYAIASRNSRTTIWILSSAANTMQNKTTNTPAASITHNNAGMETLFDMQMMITVSRNVAHPHFPKQTICREIADE